MLVKRGTLLLDIEGSYGVDASPVAADAILVEGEVAMSHDGVRTLEQAPEKATLGKEEDIQAGHLVRFEFAVAMKGSGAAGTVPEVGKALRACGMGETIVASTSVTYAPVSASLESATIYYYHAGKLQIALGCVGNVNFSYSVDDKVMANFSFVGHDGGDTDVALLSGTYDATSPLKFIGAAVSTGGYSPRVSALNFDVGNQVELPPDANSSDGYSDIIIVDRDMVGSFDPEHTLKATQDWIADWKNQVSKSITTGLVGTDAGNRVTLTCPTARYRNIDFTSRNGLRSLDIPFRAVGDDSAFSLAFT